jgi:predicted nucleic acid-binding protein
MLLSTPLLLEYEAVCQREEHRLAAGLTREDVESFLDGVAGLAEPVTVHFLWRPQLRDAADEMVLEAAVNGQAQAIVAFNHRDYGNASSRFGVLLLLPAEAYRRIEA